MIKKEYMKPEMEVVKIQQTQLICASLTDVEVLGLDDEEELVLPGTDKELDIWGNAW